MQMKTRHLLRLALAATLCLSQVGAWAQPGHGKGRDRDCRPGRANCERGPGAHHDQRRQNLALREHWEQGGAGPQRSFYRGQRLPVVYRTQRYVVEDWRGHGLRNPPRGYHWVQTGGDYVLVAIATGIILELLLNR